MSSNAVILECLKIWVHTSFRKPARLAVSLTILPTELNVNGTQLTEINTSCTLAGGSQVTRCANQASRSTRQGSSKITVRHLLPLPRTKAIRSVS